jgi:RecA/RadA recombinase
MSINKLLNSIRKNTESTSFTNSQYGEINDWIDTGDYGLNRIISGDIYKGIPSGKVILLAGESASGKSLMAANIAANALNKNNYDAIFYFDSEGGGLRDFFEKRGCDTDKIEHILLDSVEDATIKILDVYSKINEFKKENPDSKFLCILDSLGALVPTKLITDAAKGKQAQDMGLRAKLINNLMKGLVVPAIKSDTSILVINHIYDDPSSLFPSKIKSQSGGKGIQYIAHLSIQCSRKTDKEDSNSKAKEDKESAFYKAAILNFFTAKNRIAKPFLSTESYLSFTNGPLKYYGLLEPAKKYGYITSPKQGYLQVPSYSDKMFRLKELLKAPDEVWESFLDDLNEKCKQELQYSGVDENEELEIYDEIDESTDESKS